MIEGVIIVGVITDGGGGGNNDLPWHGGMPH